MTYFLKGEGAKLRGTLENLMDGFYSDQKGGESKSDIFWLAEMLLLLNSMIWLTFFRLIHPHRGDIDLVPRRYKTQLRFYANKYILFEEKMQTCGPYSMFTKLLCDRGPTKFFVLMRSQCIALFSEQPLICLKS